MDDARNGWCDQPLKNVSYHLELHNASNIHKG